MRRCKDSFRRWQESGVSSRYITHQIHLDPIVECSQKRNLACSTSYSNQCKSMKQFFAGPLRDNARNILRRMGYGEQRTRAGQISYVKRVAGERFPRYHAYIEDTNGGIQVNLHVDQKEASYEGGSAHAGEYVGPLVEAEMRRISGFVESLKGTTPSPSSTPTAEKKKGFWGTLWS